MLAIIPARAGSKGLVNKNIYALQGHPLIAWTIAAALDAGIFSRVVVSTDGEEIARISRSYGADVIERPAHLATDQALPKDAVRHVCETLAGEGFRPDLLCYMQPTSPLRRADDIVATVDLVRHGGFDSAASFTHASPHPDRAFSLTADGAAEPTYGHDAVWHLRQDRAPSFHLNGAVYVSHTDVLLGDPSSRMLHGRIGAHIMADDRSIDIDTLTDMRICEVLMSESPRPAPRRVDLP